MALLLTDGCIDQDTFGLLRRQLPSGACLEQKESSFYYLEFQEYQSILVSEIGWNSEYFVGKIDHRNDSDGSIANFRKSILVG